MILAPLSFFPTHSSTIINSKKYFREKKEEKTMRDETPHPTHHTRSDTHVVLYIMRRTNHYNHI